MRHNNISSQHINLFRIIIIKGVLSKINRYPNNPVIIVVIKDTFYIQLQCVNILLQVTGNYFDKL